MGDRVDDAFVGRFVEDWVGGVNGGDVDSLLAACTEDVKFKDPAYPEPFVGKAAVREILSAIFGAFPDMTFRLVGDPFLSLDGSRAGIRMEITATMSGPLDPPGFAPTGAPIRVDAAEFYEFRGGLASEIELMFDMLDLGRQIGAAPEVGSVADRLGVRMQRRKAKRLRRAVAT